MEDTKYENFWKIKDYQKTWSIAYFNALNNAIEMMKFRGLTELEDTKKTITFWREWFLEEHAKFYFDKIANAGLESINPKAMAGLDKAKETYEKRLPNL